MSNGLYWMRLIVLKRAEAGRKPNNEPVYAWNEQPNKKGRYSARELNLSTGEDIRNGFKETASFARLEIKGQKIDIGPEDRIKVVQTGKIYRLVGSPNRKKRTTELSLEEVNEQE